MLSIIVPTFNEGDNVQELVSRIYEILCEQDYEIIFVDDSTDGTPEILEQISISDERVRYFHREGERGLATAVTCGFERANGDILTVMDADLQHPPELLNNMLAKIDSGFDLVVPSRFIPGGSDGGLKGFRKVVSRTARLIAWISLKKSRGTTDPMSGFFMMKRHVIEEAVLKPVGWKILLEVLVKGGYGKIGEVPYRFRPRLGNTSKMCWREQWNYLRHVVCLLREDQGTRFWRFAAVGSSGVLVNLILFYLFLKLHLPVVLAGVLAATAAMFSNFLLNNSITWPDRGRKHFWRRCLLFYFFCGIGVFINGIILSILVEQLHLNSYLGQIAGILGATAWNYSSNNRWNWGSSREEPRQETVAGGDDTTA